MGNETPEPGKIHPALRRLLADPAAAAAFATLAADLPGADLKTLLLGAFRERAARLDPKDVLDQYRHDRFVAVGAVDARSLVEVELQALDLATPEFDCVVLAPVVPLGTHSALGAVPQNNVVTTTRLTEVAADPTNALALQAAVRRRDLLDAAPRSSEPVRLAGVSRVLRAQPFTGPASFAHFSLFGLVSAGRDTGNHAFEQTAMASQVGVLGAIVAACTSAPVLVRLTAFTESFAPTIDRVAADLRSDGVHVELWPEREHGRGYYRNVGFKIYATRGDEQLEVGDGGDVAWTQALLQSRKERLLIGGLGLDRLVLMAGDH